MAAIGHTNWSESGERIRVWEEKYGEYEASNGVQLTPIITRDTQGLGLSFSF